MSAEAALRAAADILHKIGADVEARRLLVTEGHKMPQPMYDGIAAKRLDPAEIATLTAEGFEVCVRALAALGASDVSIHECGVSARCTGTLVHAEFTACPVHD